MQEDVVEEWLEVELEDAAIAWRAEELASALGVIERAEIDRKQSAVDAADLIKGLKKRVKDLAKQVRERQEMAQVPCVWKRNDVEGCFDLIRTDTGEWVRSRPMTMEDRQIKLFAPRASEDFAS